MGNPTENQQILHLDRLVLVSHMISDCFGRITLQRCVCSLPPSLEVTVSPVFAVNLLLSFYTEYANIFLVIKTSSSRFQRPSE